MRNLFSIPPAQRVHLSIISFSLMTSLSHVSSRIVEKKICQTKECLSAAQNLKESIDFNVDPCDDFYKFSCGKWSESSNETRSVLKSRRIENSAEILDFIKQNNSNEDPEAVHKARKFFSVCKNKAAFNETLEPIKIILEKIGLPILPIIFDETTENYDYATALARAARLTGQYMYFTVDVYPNPYNQTVNMIGLKKGTVDFIPISSKTPSISLQNHMLEITKMICKDNHSKFCTELGTQTLDNFVENFKIVEYLNQRKEIAQIIQNPSSKLNSSSVDLFTLKKFQDLTNDIAAEVNATIPTLNWTRYIEELFADLNLNLSEPNKIHIMIEELDSIKEMIQYIHESQNTKIIELGLWWKVVLALRPFVSSDYWNEKECAVTTEVLFGMAVSYVYATKEKYIKAKTEISTMFEHIQGSLQQLIEQAPWMDEITRQRALKKLKSMKSHIAYPSMMKTPSFLNDIYKDAQITDNFYDTIISIGQKRRKEQLETINQINDPSKLDEIWTTMITPNNADAYYIYHRNIMFIPSGFLGLSIYNNSLHTLDYGAIGSIIGHEITHGFDTSGRRYNEIGNIENWWQPETARLYREKANCFVKVYGNYSTTSRNITQMGNSEVTVGEDISDNGGFKESLMAYRKSVAVSGEEPLLPQFENFTHEQLFTLAFANMWCETPDSQASLLSKFDVHSPHGVRVNGVLRNSEEFPKIWKCPKGSGMNPNEEKCSLW